MGLSCQRNPGWRREQGLKEVVSWGSCQGVRRLWMCPAPPDPGVPRRREGTYCRLPHADPRLRHGFGRFCLNHRSCRGRHGPGFLGLQGQLIGHLKRLAQGQDDLVGQVLGRSRVPASSAPSQTRPPHSHRFVSKWSEEFLAGQCFFRHDSASRTR